MSTLPSHSAVAAGDDQLAHVVAHEQGALKRTLKLRHLVFIGLAYMAPLAVFDMFGIVADQTSGHVPLAYLVVLVAVLFTAFSYSRMVRFFPIAGSAYTYAKESIHPSVGFLVGWAATLDYLLLPMINAILSGIYMGAIYPQVPFWVWVLLTVIICTALNLVGVRLAASMNVILVGIQLVVAVLFVVLAVVNISNGANGAAFTVRPFFSDDVQASALAGGAAILALSFLGFDAVSTLAEEAKRPTRDIPRAIFIIVAAAGAFFLTVTYVMQTLFPDVTKLENIVGASPEIAKYIGGAAFQAIFVGGYMMAVLGCGITQQLSAARLLYAMGRDGALPTRLFGRVNPRTGVPVANVLIVAAIALTALFVNLEQASSMINFGAFIAFTFVNLSVIFVFFRFIAKRTIGSWIGFVVIPAIGVVINVALWLSLDGISMIIGGAWTAIGVVYLLVKTRGFRAAPPDLTGPINVGMYD
ncbi:APC family permease [Microbacterium sp. 13-71-7]|jgi:putrescine importer|uniref:APC family permease n=1 Tax=Microbacterium sp. 13-71-7 TaxID=1970399 RepID=UPI000BC9C40B|nr:APC family permease [Microbacterium sp. 13-71-7]OZB83007.1 MAG: Putrescine importer PuuP [Microbacterium sp. 13-71-7]